MSPLLWKLPSVPGLIPSLRSFFSLACSQTIELALFLWDSTVLYSELDCSDLEECPPHVWGHRTGHFREPGPFSSKNGGDWPGGTSPGSGVGQTWVLISIPPPVAGGTGAHDFCSLSLQFPISKRGCALPRGVGRSRRGRCRAPGTDLACPRPHE